jgi:polysaccharide biosynthesis protein PslA
MCDIVKSPVDPADGFFYTKLFALGEPAVPLRIQKKTLLTSPCILAVVRLLARLTHFTWVAGVGYWAARSQFFSHGSEPREQLYAAIFSGTLAVIIFQAAGIYGERFLSHQLRVRAILQAWTGAFLVLVLFRPLLPALGTLTSHQWMAWYLLTLLGLGAQRLLVHLFQGHLVSQKLGLQNVVILGRTKNGSYLAEYLQNHPDIRNRLVGYVDDRKRPSEFTMADLPYLGTMEDLKQLVQDGKVQRILIAIPWSGEKRVAELIKILRQLPVHLLLVPETAMLQEVRTRVTFLGSGLPTFDISDFPLRGWAPLVKRIEDIVLASIALLLCWPVMLLIAIWIKLDSRGPVLFRQKRLGYNNRLIEVYKFRSMYTEMTDHHASAQTTKDDPRVTRVGRFIRKTSLDELPQFLNVLAGSMSMVGPRPHALETKAAGVRFEDAVDEYAARHRVKPGITGWAQVNGYRGETDTVEKIEKRVAYDLEYIENWSLWFDLYILLRTPIAVISGEAAY